MKKIEIKKHEKKVALVSYTHKRYNFGFPIKGLICIGTLIKNKGYPVKIFQRTLINKSLKKFVDIVLKYHPAFIGITVTESNSVKDNIKLIDEIRKRKKAVKILVGGPHVTAVKEEVFDYFDCDFAFYGEAEITFPEFIEKYPQYHTIKGLMYKKNKKKVVNPPPKIVKDLDTLPFLDYNIIYGINKLRKSKLKKKFSFHVGLNYIECARGCPYNCTYCLNSKLSKFRHRSPNKIVDEIEYNLKIFNNPYFDFASNVFTYDKKWLRELVEEITKRGLKIKYYINTRIDLIDDEIIDLLHSSGCSMIHIGFETGSKKLLNEYNKFKKKIQYKKQITTVRKLKKKGIWIKAFVMIGDQKESFLDILKTLLLLLRLRSVPYYQLFNAYPGTTVYEEYCDKGIMDKRWYIKSERCNILSPIKYWIIKGIIDWNNGIVIGISRFMRYINPPKKL